MTLAVFDVLQCPRCKGTLEPTEFECGRGRIEHGIVECTCATFPIVAGIATVKFDVATAVATSLLHDQRYDDALAVLLGQRAVPAGSILDRTIASARSLSELVSVDSAGLSHRVLGGLARVVSHHGKIGEWTTFQDGVAAMYGSRPGCFDEYLRYRPFCHSFWTLHAVLPLLSRSDGLVLDLGGGAGHGARLISHLLQRPVCAVDTDVGLLYLHTQFMDQTAAAVAIERTHDLPFAREAFATSINIDGLHYFERKYQTGSELHRVTAPNGELLLLHQHTDRAHPHAGIPLSAQGYRDCVPRDGVMVAEDELLEEFLGATERLDLVDREAVDGDVSFVCVPDTSDTLSVPKARNPLFEGETSMLVNPLYRLENGSGGRYIERAMTSRCFRSEFSFSFDRTEPRYRLTGDTPLHDLVARGVLFPFPRAYPPGVPAAPI